MKKKPEKKPKIHLKINSQRASWKARDAFISFLNTHRIQTLIYEDQILWGNAVIFREFRHIPSKILFLSHVKRLEGSIPNC